MVDPQTTMTPVTAEPVKLHDHDAPDATTLDTLKNAALLIVDDEPGMRNFLSRILVNHCALVESADSVDSAEALRSRYHFDLLIVDIRLPGKSGIEWLQQLREQGVATDVVFITAYADLETAVAALRAGAADFILKPFRSEQILASAERCLQQRRTHQENVMLRRRFSPSQAMDEILGVSEVIAQTRAIVSRVAPTNATVLIEGETGTGKELIARAVHELSERDGAFVPVNCGSIPPELLESELFGHTRGAFTGAHEAREGLFSFAHRGTLFLDEVSELPLSMQSKLLRALENQSVRPVGADREQPVDVRVLAATNRSLEEAAAEGRFREDLLYRLNVLTITIAPLRERREDLALLCEHFNHSVAAELGLAPATLTHQDSLKLQAYDWPGNVRELRNVIERALLLGKSPGECCPSSGETPVFTAPGSTLNLTLAEAEKQHILRVYEDSDANKSAAARRLGISRKTLERKLRSWQAHRDD